MNREVPNVEDGNCLIKAAHLIADQYPKIFGRLPDVVEALTHWEHEKASRDNK